MKVFIGVYYAIGVLFNYIIIIVLNYGAEGSWSGFALLSGLVCLVLLYK